MIRDALLASKSPLSVHEIYQFITDKYPFFRGNNHLHWKNSVRHNLTQYSGKYFRRVNNVDGKTPPRPAFVWTLSPNWEDMDSIVTKHTIPETPQAMKRKHNAKVKGKKSRKVKKPSSGKRQNVAPVNLESSKLSSQLNHADYPDVEDAELKPDVAERPSKAASLTNLRVNTRVRTPPSKW